MWPGWVQRNSNGPLVPTVRLVPIENDVILMVLLVNMHLIKVSFHPQAPSALLLLISTPINRSFSESLIVPDYCLFLLKNQNINAIQK